MTVDQCFDALQKHYGLSKEDLLKKEKTSVLVEARKILIYFLRHTQYMTFSKIGEIVERHHSTVMHSYYNCVNQIEIYQDFETKVHLIMSKILFNSRVDN